MRRITKSLTVLANVIQILVLLLVMDVWKNVEMGLCLYLGFRDVCSVPYILPIVIDAKIPLLVWNAMIICFWIMGFVYPFALKELSPKKQLIHFLLFLIAMPARQTVQVVLIRHFA